MGYWTNKRVVLLNLFITLSAAYQQKCLYKLMKDISFDKPENYQFILYAFESEPSVFPDCFSETQTDHLFFQMCVISTPLIPFLNTIETSTTKLRIPTQLSLERFDIILTPSCTRFYPPEQNQPYIPNELININDFRLRHLKQPLNFSYMAVDDYGALRLQMYFNQPSTLLVVIRTCLTENYMFISVLNEWMPIFPVLFFFDLTKTVFIFRDIPPAFQFTSFYQQRSPLDVVKIHKWLYGTQTVGYTTLHFLYDKNLFTDSIPVSPEQCPDNVFKLAAICTEQMLSTQTLARFVFNQTIHMYNYYDPYELYQHHLKTGGRYTIAPLLNNPLEILQSMNSENDVMARLLVSTIQVVSFDSIRVIYCKNLTATTKTKLEFSVWFNPIHNSLIGFGIFLLIVNLFHSHLIKKFGDCIQAYQTAHEELLRSYMFTALFVGMMIRGYYENEITSLVTVPEPEKVLTSLYELFDASYRFFWLEFGSARALQRSGTSRNVSEILSNEFNIHGVDENFNDSSNLIQNDTFPNFTSNYLSVKGSYGTMNSVAKLELLWVNSILRSKNKQCFILPINLYNTIFTYQVMLPNRYWYLRAYSWLDASGLPNLWRDWWQHGVILRQKFYKIYDNSLEYSIDNVGDIELGHILASLVILVSVYAFGLIILVCENVWNYKTKVWKHAKVLSVRSSRILSF